MSQFVSWFKAIGLILAGITLVVLACLVVWSADVARLRQAVGTHTTGELIRHAQRRLQGHTRLEAALARPLRWMQTQVERPVALGKVPSLGKGLQEWALPPVQYLPNGQPIAQLATRAATPPAGRLAVVSVRSADELVRAIQAAKAGQSIQIAPGHYVFNRRVATGAAGTKAQPITVWATAPGQVTIELDTVEGFYVAHPFWVFENLHIRGICKQHSNCEHAFHIVGAASSTVVRNNLIEDFNAHIKVNGIGDAWPDDGLLQFNTLSNRTRRETSAPVAPVDIVAANRWQVTDNIISNFVKAQGNQVSFGLFMKGGGSGGRIERNLVVCTPNNMSQPGVRVGLSFGGGKTDKPFCRNQRCDFEHMVGMAVNNIVIHCNDFGIDVNQASTVLVAHNTLVNTAGIDVRSNSTAVRVYANLLEGRVRARDRSDMQLDMNEIVSMAAVFAGADVLQFEWLAPPANIPSLPLVHKDFCGLARADGTLPGALADQAGCLQPGGAL